MKPYVQAISSSPFPSYHRAYVDQGASPHRFRRCVHPILRDGTAEPITQPTQTQAQSAPCTTGQPQAANNQSNKSGTSLADRIRKKVDDVSDNLSKQAGGIPLPKSGDIAGGKPKPCPPAVAPNTQVAPVLHLPAGVTTVWACNPIITSTNARHTVSLITAEQLTRAEPAQANTFEADTASSDGNAALPCANLRRDPKTNKVFLPQ